MLIHRLLKDKNRLLLLGFATYVILMLSFAGVYYRIYKSDRYAFLFANDMQTSQAKTFATVAGEELNELSMKAAVVTQAITQLRRKSPMNIVDLYRVPLADGGHLLLSQVLIASPVGPAGAWRTLTVDDPYARETLRWNPPGSRYWSTEADTIITELEVEASRLTAEHASILTRVQTLTTSRPDVWSFWDFLYFSVMTQGTVGYGDIIPNNTSVRLLVVLQVLAGYLVLIDRLCQLGHRNRKALDVAWAST